MGPVSLYHLGKVKPNPWDQLANETEAVVAAMPEKPERVDVTVTAFRLVRKDEAAPVTLGDAVQVQVGDRRSTAGGRAAVGDAMNYQAALNAQQSGDQATLQRVGSAMTGQGPTTTNGAPPLGIQVGTPKSVGGELTFFDEYTSGATCEIHAVIRLTFVSGQEQVLTLKGLGASQNTSGTAYWGEALEFSVRQAVWNFGKQFRQGVGLPAE